MNSAYFIVNSLPENLSKDAREQMGGKAFGLYLAKKQGLDIPESLVLPSPVIRRFLLTLDSFGPLCQSWRVATEIEQIRVTLDALRLEIAQAFESPYGTGLTGSGLWSCIDAMAESSKKAGWEKIILRSSVNIEDSDGISLAGCFTSMTTLLTERELLQTASTIVQNFYDLDALRQVANGGLLLEDFRPAILWQPFRKSPWAGVAFSRNPKNPWKKPEKPGLFYNKKKIWGYVEAAHDGADVICQGKNPDHRWDLGAPCPRDFEPAVWSQLSSSLRILDKAFGGPVDVEWLVFQNRLVILQVRSVSTFESQLIASHGEGFKCDRTKTAERFPEPMSPLGWDILQPSIQAATRELEKFLNLKPQTLGIPAVSWGGWIFACSKAFDISQVLSVNLRMIITVPIKLLNLASQCLIPSIKRCWLDQSIKGGMRYSIGLVLELALKNKIVATLSEYEARKVRLLEGLPQLEQDVEKAAKNVEPVADMETLLAWIKNSLHLGADFMASDFTVFLAREWMGWCHEIKWSYGHAKGEVNSRLPAAKSLREIHLLGKNPSTEMLWGLEDFFKRLHQPEERVRAKKFFESLDAANNIQDLRRLSKIFLDPNDPNDPKPPYQRDVKTLGDRWLGWLERYGSVRESWDVMRPSWTEEPSALKRILKDLFQMLQTRDGYPSIRNKSKSPDRQTVKVISCLDSSQQALLESVMSTDEEQRVLAARLLANARAILILVGDALVNRKTLEHRDQIFYLSLNEVLSAIQGNLPFASLIARNSKARWQRHAGLQVPWVLGAVKDQTPSVALPLGSWWSQVRHKQNLLKLHHHDEPNLRGTSGGIALGHAIYANTLEDAAKVPEGAILFTQQPKPEFVAIYPRLGGLVTQRGGMLSHGFIAARECGLPAVAGYTKMQGIGTHLGLVRIDGTKGIVEFVPCAGH